MATLTQRQILNGKSNLVMGNQQLLDLYRNGSKNIYEDVVQDSIFKLLLEDKDVNEKARIHSLYNEYIKPGASPLRKRGLLLLAITNSRASGKEIDEKLRQVALTMNSGNIIEHLNNSISFLREFVEFGKTETKQFGEVMTPLTLVEEMLDTLPKDVWSNPTLKWFDPANGTGPYPFCVIKRLMVGLETVIPDEKERYRHIIEDMIYVSELQMTNMFLYMVLVDPQDIYKLNIYTGSFLDQDFDSHMKNVWELNNFDIIIGNPPYQELKDGFTKSKPLWNEFVIKSYKLLNNNGYLSMVHPDGWRAASGKFNNIRLLFCENQLIYLKMHNKYKGMEVFNASTTFDYYCLRKAPNNSYKTTIHGQNDIIYNIDISTLSFIPNGMIYEINNIIAKEGDEKVNMIADSAYHHSREHVSKVMYSEYKYPVVYTILKSGKVNIHYSNCNNKGHFGIPKVIWSNGISTPTVDIDGKYGLTEFAFAIVDDIENLENIRTAMLSEKFIKLMAMTDGNTGTGHRYNKKAISTFRKDFWKDFI